MNHGRCFCKFGKKLAVAMKMCYPKEKNLIILRE